MDYQKIYDKFISHFKSTMPYERMIGRNQNDFRISHTKLYTESHHITPKSLGGLDIKENLVDLLPEEHLFIHALRYKAFNTKEDMIAVRLIINGMNNNSRYGLLPLSVTKKILATYAWMKQCSSTFRYEHGWQTPEGRARISAARKNKMNAKCAATGEFLGMVEMNHPKVISGEWVHHTKGKHTYVNVITGETTFCDVNDLVGNNDWRPLSLDVAGVNNPRYSGFSDEFILEYSKKVIGYLIINYNLTCIIAYKTIKRIWDIQHPNNKFPNLGGGLRSGFRFSGDIHANYYNTLHNEFNLPIMLNSKFMRKINLMEIANAID